MKIKFKHLFLSISTGLFISFSCNNAINETKPGQSIVEDDSVFIIDRTGKKWNITHAVKKYDMKPENFNYGLGPYAIKPINDPQMVSPGENGYPDNSYNGKILGIEINGEARAYAIAPLTRHEVVNDLLQGQPIAPVY